MRASEFISEEWSAKYKRSINCAHPKGFSQKAHCAGRKKNEDLTEFAPGGNSASSYYAVTENFINEFTQQKQEELQDLIDAGWTKQDLAQAGTLQAQAADIAHLEQVRDGFLKGLKPGFDAYLRGDTQMKDQLGEYWLDNDLPLNQDWESIYGEPWGDDGLDEALNEFSFGNDDDDGRVPDPYGQPKPQHYNRSIDFFGQFEANWFDKEDMNDATGEFKGYWNNSNGKPTQIAYFKFDNPRRTGSNHPGMGWYYEPELDETLNELSFLGSQCTKDCSGHRAGYEWSQRKGGTDAASWSPSFNKGAWLHNNGF